MKATKILMSIAALIAITGCGDKHNDAKQERSEERRETKLGGEALIMPKGFLTLTDLEKPASLPNLTGEEVAQEIHNTSEIAYSDEDETTDPEDTEQSSCMDELMAKNSTVKATKFFVTIEATVDFTECDKEMMADLGVIKTETRIFFMLGCTGADFSSLNGAPFSTLESKVAEPCRSGESYVLTNTRTTMRIENKTDSYHFAYDMVSMNATANADGTACKSTMKGNEQVFADGCVITSKEAYTNVVGNDMLQLRDMYKRLEYKGVTGVKDKRYFKTGAMNVQINNWSGEVKFTGSESHPEWKVMHGTETASGRYGIRE